MTDKLKPCPFCGGNNIGVFKHEYFYKSHLYAANCYDCHFGLKMVATEEEAIKAWNTRRPMDRIVEQLERLPNVNSDYWNFADLIDREDAIDIVKGVQNE